MERHRNISTNTFEGGLDLDSDIRRVASNKSIDSINIDIKRSGDHFSLVDLRGETEIAELEDNLATNIKVLNSTEARFLYYPTTESKDSVVVFYIASIGGVNYLKIKAVIVDTGEIIEIYEESISDEDFNTIKYSSVDTLVVGSFGYDTIYFVDNVRQPRKIECIVYRTNDCVLNIFHNSTDDLGSFKRVNLDINVILSPVDDFRAYIYAYKNGFAHEENIYDGNTDTVKYIDVSTSSTSESTYFDIYASDYDDFVFQIRYHRELGVLYNNFLIGSPDSVNLSL